MWRLCGSFGWQAGALLPRASTRMPRTTSPDCRGAFRRWTTPSAARHLRGPRCGAMRLLHAGYFSDGQSVARCESASVAGSNSGSALGESLPLHGISADLRSCGSGYGQDGRKRGGRALSACRVARRSSRLGICFALSFAKSTSLAPQKRPERKERASLEMTTKCAFQRVAEISEPCCVRARAERLDVRSRRKV